MFVGWVLIFGAAFVIFTLKDEFLALGNRLMLEARGGTMEEGPGGEVRIRQAPDGHFWVDAELNGQTRALPGRQRRHHDQHLAADRRARRHRSAARGFGTMVQTANGIVMVDRGRAESLEGRADRAPRRRGPHLRRRSARST